MCIGDVVLLNIKRFCYNFRKDILLNINRFLERNIKEIVFFFKDKIIFELFKRDIGKKIFI